MRNRALARAAVPCSVNTALLAPKGRRDWNFRSVCLEL